MLIPCFNVLPQDGRKATIATDAHEKAPTNERHEKLIDYERVMPRETKLNDLPEVCVFACACVVGSAIYNNFILEQIPLYHLKLMVCHQYFVLGEFFHKHLFFFYFQYIKNIIIFEIFDLMFFDWVSFLAYPNLFGIKGFVVVVVVYKK
jgi:hypothetical protein